MCHLKNQGSNGEVAYLSEEERVAIVKAVRETVPRESGKLIIAGEQVPLWLRYPIFVAD